VNVAIWLAYVLGGFGLIRGNGWGRSLTLVAAGGSLMVMFLLSIAAENELNYYSPVWILGAMPALAILLSALLIKVPLSNEVEVPPSTGTPRKPRISKRTRHDIAIRNIAYGCYAVLGLVFLWAAFWTGYAIIVDGIGGDAWSSICGYLGFLVIFPLFIPFLAALAIASLLSLVIQWRRRDVTLIALLGITWLVLWLIGSDVLFKNIANAKTAVSLFFCILAAYGLTAVTVSALYFLLSTQKSNG
jgi:hypothetical protein